MIRVPLRLRAMASGAGRGLLPSAALFLFLLFSSALIWAAARGAEGTPFNVGVILDMGSNWNGNISWTCISMAVDDFYTAHPENRTRVVLHLRDSGEDTMGAAAAALDLLKNVQVQAMIGPMRSAQAKFVMQLGNRSQVPVISFSAKSPSLSSPSTEYFIRTAMNDKSQAKAIAAIVQAFRWREVVPIFEDTEYGRGIVPDLIDELGEVDAHVPYRSMIPLTATKDQILSELYKLKAMQTRIFVVHTTCKLGFQLFSMAKEARMMEEGYVWITTYGLTDLPDIMGPNATDVMQGVLGVKPYVQETKRLKGFKVRWRRKFYLENPFNTELNEPTVFGLWAYDTVWALAMAAERIRTANFAYQNVSRNSSSTDFEGLGLSPIGSELLSLILNTEFDGLSGRFHLVLGQLDNTTIEIVNVIDTGKKRIGFWTASQGVSRHLNSKADLKIVIWPGKSTSVPKGWEWPTSGKKLQIGVPVKPGFHEFADLNRGFCIQVFNAVMKALPYLVPFEYVPYADAHGNSNGTYDDLVYQVYLKSSFTVGTSTLHSLPFFPALVLLLFVALLFDKGLFISSRSLILFSVKKIQKFDAVVGDITIIANRSKYVDFTLPFTESGVQMVVPIKENRPKNAWTFTEPLSGDLWFASGCFFIFTGLVVWFLEHRVNEEFRGPPSHQLGTVFYFSFSTLVFAHRERLVNNLSRLVVIIWVFVVLILTSSYTASLSSMLTVKQLQPTVTELNDLIKRGDHVGCLNDSFMPGLLNRLNFNQSKLIAYNSPDEYAEALNKGSENGGVSAIIDELPYIKVFLSKYCGKYTMVGPTYKTDGFGFVFPKGSPLVPDVSRAILNVTEGELFAKFQKELYGEHQCPDQGNDIASSSLRLDSFWGLFLITGVASTFALILCLVLFFYKNSHVFGTLGSDSSVLQKLHFLARLYDQKDPSSHAFKNEDRQMMGTELTVGSPYLVNQPRSPSSISNHTYGNFDADEGIQTPLEGEGTPGRDIARQNPDFPSFEMHKSKLCITFAQVVLVADFGNKAQSSDSQQPALHSHHLLRSHSVRTALHDAHQVNVVSSIINHFGWRDVVP
ncbi:hypothetical protein Taro_034132 [Colocasia esculenta]|uniref:Ionotropic glutamate receptor C-terminal domain-containing protein n=1 Tax=Colocasia esculenta TaxID=4460 RepID=A0A843WB12_COLES|nr:hypothetical protein [Colocasia esculenta]